MENVITVECTWEDNYNKKATFCPSEACFKKDYPIVIRIRWKIGFSVNAF